LVAHSIRFTQSGTVKIAARFDEAARRLSISIEDDGGGLTDDEFANLFEPMALGAATQRFGCTGMELPIARQIVERTGGKLSAENSPGKGCRFTIAVEVEMADDDDVARFEQELAPLSRDDDEPAPIVQTKIAGEILLVEDCPDNRRLVTQVLANAGAEMAVAENGRDGFDLAMGAWISGKPYGVLLFDMKLPGESGYEVVRRLRDAGYDQPIIALTAHAMEGDAEKCLEAGCDAYVAKPFDVRDLIATIASVIAPSIDKPPAKQLA
jgi:CheY-like chemotaxis protein